MKNERSKSKLKNFITFLLFLKIKSDVECIPDPEKYDYLIKIEIFFTILTPHKVPAE